MKLRTSYFMAGEDFPANGFRSYLHSPQSFLGLMVVAVVIGMAIGVPGFFTADNTFNIGQQTAVIAIGTFCLTALIIARGIDLSIGANLALSGMISATTYQATGSVVLALTTCLVSGGLVGLINGILVGFGGISPFMATLATMTFARGASLAISDAQSISITDPAFVWLGSGTLLGAPSSVLVACATFIVWLAVMNRTVFGRWIYAVGGNESAAKASLIPVRRVQVLLYVFSGLSAGIGAIITIGRLGSAQPLAGVGLEFACITAVMVGGAALSGGKGSVSSSLLGAILLGIIGSALSFFQIQQQFIYIFTGGFLLAATLLTLERSRAQRAGKRLAQKITIAPAHTDSKKYLKVIGLRKSYNGFRALKNATFEIGVGQVVGLLGENGAGKSTLVKCLTGVQSHDGGTIQFCGRDIVLSHTAHAKDVGISAIHQHFSLIPDLTIAENLYLAHGAAGVGMVKQAALRAAAREALERVKLEVSPDTRVADLTVGQKQMVEIAKALASDAWLIIMDEPSSALSVRERDRLYELVRELTSSGCAVLYISHKLNEIFDLCSDIVVLRDGTMVSEGPISAYSSETIISSMVGRAVDNVFPHADVSIGDVVLEVSDLSDGGRLKNASLKLRAGETVAIAGLMGSGRSELLRCIAGHSTRSTGSVYLSGRSLQNGNAKDAFAAGIALVPEDRHAEGFVGKMSVADNLSLVWLTTKNWLVSTKDVKLLARDLIAQLGVRPPNPSTEVINLSGGNQQKVVIGKWLATSPKVILLDEPTNGVDVGAKSEIHNLILELKRVGTAVLMVSSELPEVLGVADRILVMAHGNIVGEVPRGASEEEVMSLAFVTRHQAVAS